MQMLIRLFSWGWHAHHEPEVSRHQLWACGLASANIAKEGEAQVIFIMDGCCRYEAAKLAVSEGAEIIKVLVVIVSQGTSI